jgi:hypothetical protein
MVDQMLGHRQGALPDIEIEVHDPIDGFVEVF